MTNYFHCDRNGQKQDSINDQQIQTVAGQISGRCRWLAMIIGVVLLLLLGGGWWMSDSS